ncbi:RNA-directed DNA polymerase, eukaryota, reverse transcriptase zinc-binding domain protein [Tanacetum coccineum]
MHWGGQVMGLETAMKTGKKKNATKNKGKNTGYKLDGCGVNGDVGVSDTMGEIVEEMEAMDDREGDNSNGGMSSEEEVRGVSKENDDIKEVNAVRKTFAKIDENGVEVVVFDDVMVAEGIKRWDLTLCGFFVGHKMAVNELRYNLRRMWSRFGFKDIVDYNNGVYYMKFHHEEGLNNVVNSGPWMIVPIEAWTVKGISALASIIRKPLIMDYVTASKCKQGVGLVRFARVLIKVNAKKEMSDNVEVVYKSSKGSFQCRKNIKVIYDWKSPVCTDCGVFGHDDRKCPKKVAINLIKDRSEKSETVMQNQSNENGRKDQEGFVEVRSKKNVGINKKVKRPNFRANPQNNRHGNNVKNVYQAKNKSQVDKDKTPLRTSEKVSKESPDMKNDKASGSDKKVHEESIKKWYVHKDILDAMKRSANKYSLFELYDVDEQNELRDLKKMEQKKELLVDKGELVEEEDVLEEVNGIARNFKIGTWNIRGLSSSDKQKEVMKFIKEENLQVCAILETHLKNKRIVSVCDRIYGRWNWITNMRYCNKGCRIMIGWNEDVVSIFVIHMARQSAFEKLETISNVKFYGAFIYAANGGIEMRELWKDLEIYRRIVGTDPWYLSGDMNVTLAPNKHSVGGSNVSSDMKEEVVKEVQHKIDKDPHNHDLRSEEAGTFKAYTEAMKEEELILYQNAKVQWLSVGDRNNAYFHKAIRSRQQRNRIDAICDENGSRVEGGEVAEQFVNHFQIFLGESNKVGKISNMESLFQNKLSEEDDMAMIREVTDDEIKQAMFKIDDNKI